MKSNNKFKKFMSLALSSAIVMSMSAVSMSVTAVTQDSDCVVDIGELTVTTDGNTEDIKSYSIDDFDTFYDDYSSDSLPEIYITDFVFDGIGAVKKYDLEDGVVTVEDISTTAINVNMTGSVEFTGTAKKTMISVDTNGVKEDIDLILNNVTLTSKNSTPAIMVCNKDVTYSDCSVTIVPKAGTSNYITGGRLKKVSTMNKDSLSGTYATYSEYYGVYSSDELNQLIFASETADSEGLADGDPKTYYKGNGAISSDIDLNFCGEGYLEITSTKKEGVETKGDLNFNGGIGDYKITAYDDCLNATTNGTSIYINVNSLGAYVEVEDGEESPEGDGIDSNGSLTIDCGLICSYSCSSSEDNGIDADSGITINGGTVIATGNMGSSINSTKLNYMNLTFSSSQSEGSLYCIADSEYNPVMAIETPNSFKNLVVCSSELEQATYYLYKGGSVSGISINGYYSPLYGYQSGTQQAYSGTSSGNQPGGNNRPGRPGSSTGGQTTGASTAFTITSSQRTFSGISDASSTVEITMPATEPTTEEPATEAIESSATEEPTTVPTQTILIGDADSNGVVTISDATAIQKYIADQLVLTETQIIASECDGDGLVNIKDATCIQKYLVGADGCGNVGQYTEV